MPRWLRVSRRSNVTPTSSTLRAWPGPPRHRFAAAAAVVAHRRKAYPLHRLIVKRGGRGLASAWRVSMPHWILVAATALLAGAVGGYQVRSPVDRSREPPGHDVNRRTRRIMVY